MSEPTTDRSATPTPALVRSGLAALSIVRIHDMNSNPLETQNVSATGVTENIPQSNTIKPSTKSRLLNFTREAESSNIEKDGFAARRTFSGSGSDVWLEFIRYFENLMALNK